MTGSGFGLGRSLGLIMGTVLIYFCVIFLPTACSCKEVGPTKEPLTRRFHMEILSKVGEARHLPPPVSNFLAARSRIPAAAAEEKFFFASIAVVSYDYLFQPPGTVCLIRRMRMEGGGLVDDCLVVRWDVTLSYLFIYLFGCATPVSTAKGWKLKDIHNIMLKEQIK